MDYFCCFHCLLPVNRKYPSLKQTSIFFTYYEKIHPIPVSIDFTEYCSCSNAGFGRK